MLPLNGVRGSGGAEAEEAVGAGGRGRCDGSENVEEAEVFGGGLAGRTRPGMTSEDRGKKRAMPMGSSEDLMFLPKDFGVRM
jgi:hypothetical protein